jgi:hypothetical protein
MVEAILNKSTDYTTIEPQPRGDEVSPVTLSVIIPMFDEADGEFGRLRRGAVQLLQHHIVPRDRGDPPDKEQTTSLQR